MRAWLLHRHHRLRETTRPLSLDRLADPEPGPGELLLRLRACGVCHTELDEIEGRVSISSFPVVPGHEVVGVVEATGDANARFAVGTRVGVGWIYDACGSCEYCQSGRENLCSRFRGTGRDANGGYAELMTVPSESAYPVPDVYTDVEAAPLLCAGGVGYRSLRLAGLEDGQRLGLAGFGASGHLVAQVARYQLPRTRLFVFARSPAQRDQARELGAAWAGAIDEEPPELLHAVIDTTPVWTPPLVALRRLAPGGRLVINAIGKRDTDRHVLAEIDYQRQLWLEKEIKTVANVTRRDIAEFLPLAGTIPIRPEVTSYPFEQANAALLDLYRGSGRGAKVLVME